MSEKLYNLEEVLEMEGSEFTARDGLLVKCISGVLNVYCRKKYEACGVSKFWLNNEYKLVNKPVTFSDVLESNKRCRVEHEIVEAILLTANYEGECIYIEKGFKAIEEGKYLKLEDILLVICRFAGTGEIQKIIKNGRWFLEE
jgi:hypothetical protein